MYLYACKYVHQWESLLSLSLSSVDPRGQNLLRPQKVALSNQTSGQPQDGFGLISWFCFLMISLPSASRRLIVEPNQRGPKDIRSQDL